jgi:thiol-disulfide isomerase/thioredoxin
MRFHPVVAAILGCLLAATSAQAAKTLQVGDDPPPKLGWHTKLADYRGKVVIVSFWASWCGPCRKELPIMASIQKQATRDQVVVLSVNWRESAGRFDQIKRALKELDLTFISDEDGYIGDQYGVKAIPHMVIIGRDGRIRAIHIGYSEGEIPVLADEINAMLKEAPAHP